MTRIDPRLMRRFKLRGDPGAAVKLRYGLWKRSWHSTGSTLPAEDELWLRVVERESGAVGRLCPRGERYWWAKEVAREALARRVLVAKIPWTVPLMHVGPGIVHAEPPPVIERPTLSLGAAAECALMACEVVVRTRALRCNGDGDCVYFGPRNLRVIEADGRWRIAWLVPGIAELAVLDRLAARAKQQGKDHSAADTTPAGEVRDLFFSLLPAAARGARPELRALAARHGDGRDDVVSLAASFLALLDTPGEWTDRVAELAAIAGGPPAEQDWDFIITEGKAESSDDPYITFPLAAAYHQRACRSAARGDLVAALHDVDHALAIDPFVAYRLSRAALLERLEQGAVARFELAAAFADPALARPPATGGRPSYVTSLEYVDGEWVHTTSVRADVHARAHAIRGMFRCHDGDLDGAAEDLRRALELHETAEVAHALGAALYACGDLEGAAAVERRSVELAPHNARHRWALVISLLRLDRREEAHELARSTVALAPDDPAYRERFARLFGA
jgi:tetratricopeptide (TPR) repeat protein